jgi:CrcB protein
VTDPAPLPRLLLAVAVGGALGALLRWSLGQAVPDGSGFPWTTFGINVVGSLALALLPAWTAVRRSQTLAVAAGPGVLGGFTTLSAYAEQSRSLLADGRTAPAAAYLLGTLAACLVAVAIANHWSEPPARAEFADEGGDE